MIVGQGVSQEDNVVQIAAFTYYTLPQNESENKWEMAMGK